MWNLKEMPMPSSSTSFRKIFLGVFFALFIVVIAFVVVHKARRSVAEEAQAEQAAGQKVLAGKAVQHTASGEVVVEIPASRLQQLEIVVDRATEQTFVPRVILVGEIAARPNSMVDVVSPVGGRLVADSRAHPVSVGDVVASGEILAVVENLEAGLQGVATEAHVQEARSRVSQAKVDLDRVEQLYKAKAIALKDVQQAKLNLQIAENDLRSFENQNQLYWSARWIEKDVASPGRFFVRSPLSGVVTASNYRVGQSLGSNQVMLSVADVSSVIAQGNVFYEALSSIHPGERAVVRVSAYPGKEFSSRLRSVADTVDPATKTVRVLFEVPNPHRELKIGMPAEIEIEMEAQAKGILIPASSILSEEGSSAIYVRVSPNQFVRREVVLGARVGDRVEIKSGLKPGESFVSKGPISIKAESLRGSFAGEEPEEHEAKKKE